MPMTAYTAASNANIVLGVGVIYWMPSAANVLLGATIGEISLDLGADYKELAASGILQPMVGLVKTAALRPVLKGTLLVVSEQILNRLVLPKSTAAAGAVGEGNVVTPAAPGTMLVDADYLANVRWISDKATATAEWAEVHFPRSIAKNVRVMGQEEQGWRVELEFHAVQQNASTPILNMKPARTALPT
jgi:hypothetical protein